MLNGPVIQPCNAKPVGERLLAKDLEANDSDDEVSHEKLAEDDYSIDAIDLDGSEAESEDGDLHLNRSAAFSNPKTDIKPKDSKANTTAQDFIPSSAAKTAGLDLKRDKANARAKKDTDNLESTSDTSDLGSELDFADSGEEQDLLSSAQDDDNAKKDTDNLDSTWDTSELGSEQDVTDLGEEQDLFSSAQDNDEFDDAESDEVEDATSAASESEKFKVGNKIPSLSDSAYANDIERKVREKVKEIATIPAGDKMTVQIPNAQSFNVKFLNADFNNVLNKFKKVIDTELANLNDRVKVTKNIVARKVTEIDGQLQKTQDKFNTKIGELESHVRSLDQALNENASTLDIYLSKIDQILNRLGIKKPTPAADSRNSTPEMTTDADDTKTKSTEVQDAEVKEDIKTDDVGVQVNKLAGGRRSRKQNKVSK